MLSDELGKVYIAKYQHERVVGEQQFAASLLKLKNFINCAQVEMKSLLEDFSFKGDFFANGPRWM